MEFITIEKLEAYIEKKSGEILNEIEETRAIAHPKGHLKGL